MFVLGKPPSLFLNLSITRKHSGKTGKASGNKHELITKRPFVNYG